MPKLPGGVTKSRRQNTLREILARWESRDKSQIDEHVAQALGIDPAAIRKPLYEDLSELEHAGEIVKTYYLPDGSKVDEYDPAIHKSTKCIWSIPRAEGQVSGAGALKSQGAELIVSNVLRNDVRVDQGSRPVETSHTHIFFNLNSYFFSIRINSAMLPATLVVARVSESTSGNTLRLNEYFKSLEKEFGVRLLLLVVPSTGVSAPKPPERLGHFSFEIKSPKEALLRDLGSSNGTQYAKLKPEESDELIADGSVIGLQTVTRSWNHQPLDEATFTECGPHMVRPVSFPVLIQASDSFRIIGVT